MRYIFAQSELGPSSLKNIVHVLTIHLIVVSASYGYSVLNKTNDNAINNLLWSLHFYTNIIYYRNTL